MPGRERDAGAYGTPAYYTAVLLFDIVPMRVVPPLFFAMFSYWMIGLHTQCTSCIFAFIGTAIAPVCCFQHVHVTAAASALIYIYIYIYFIHIYLLGEVVCNAVIGTEGHVRFDCICRLCICTHTKKTQNLPNWACASE